MKVLEAEIVAAKDELAEQLEQLPEHIHDDQILARLASGKWGYGVARELCLQMRSAVQNYRQVAERLEIMKRLVRSQERLDKLRTAEGK
jgi:Rod binding domain-containing protein